VRSIAKGAKNRKGRKDIALFAGTLRPLRYKNNIEKNTFSSVLSTFTLQNQRK